MKKILITLFASTIILSVTACSESTTIETTTTTEQSTTIKGTSMEEYKKEINSLTKKIEDASVLISNMAKYEYNYMSSLYKISGRKESDDVVEHALDWLEEEGNISRERIDTDFKEITDLYFKFDEMNVVGNVSTLKEKVSDLYDDYSSFYTLATTANVLDGFLDEYNDHVETITNLVNVLKTLTETEE